MDDDKIIELYWNRDERAIRETEDKYGRYCYTVAYNILGEHLDTEECVNDTYLEVWNSVPPQRPTVLSSFLAMITRRQALDRYRYNKAQRRESNNTLVSLSEIEGVISDIMSVNDEIDDMLLAELISAFLRDLPEKECNVFLRRYWFFDSIDEICRRYGYGQSKVKMMLKRTRDKLAKYFEKENIDI